MKIKGGISILIPSLMIFIGSLTHYLYSYRYSSIGYISYFLFFLGWLLILTIVTGGRVLSDKKIKFKGNKLNWAKDKIFSFLFYATSTLLILGNVYIVEELANQRRANILQSGHTRNTVATITGLESRNSRGGPRPYAILSYSVDGKIITQSVFNGRSLFFVGQKCNIKYATDYPEMFSIMQMGIRHN